MAAEWPEVSLRDVAQLLTGFPFKSALYTEDSGAPRLLRGDNVVQGGIRWDGAKRWSASRVAGQEAYWLKPGDVVLAMDRPWIEAGLKYATVRESDTPCLLVQRVARLRGTAALDDGYLIYVIADQSFTSYVLSIQTGTAVPHISGGQILEYRFCLPSLSEQRAIANILRSLDDKIDLNRRMNQTLEALARAIFKSWFLDFDPVRAKAERRRPVGMDAETAALFPDRMQASEIGEIPAGWRASTLGAEAERCRGTIQTGPFGSQLHASDYVPDGIPVVMPKDISGRRVSTASIARIREHDAERLARHRLQLGDVVYSRRGDVERHALIGTREIGWLCGTGCLLVRLGAEWQSPMFASLALDVPETRAWISQHAIGATMPNLNTGILSAVPLVMPPDDVLRAFERAVAPMQNLGVAKDAEAALLASIRDELLPRLLSGELRVPDAEKMAEAAL